MDDYLLELVQLIRDADHVLTDENVVEKYKREIIELANAIVDDEDLEAFMTEREEDDDRE